MNAGERGVTRMDVAALVLGITGCLLLHLGQRLRKAAV